MLSNEVEVVNLRNLLTVLKEFGVIEFSSGKTSIKMQLQLPESLVKMPDQLTEVQQKEIMQKIETMKSVMQLDDDNLVDRLFPATPEEGSSEL